MTALEFRGWTTFNAALQRTVLKKWLTRVRTDSQDAFTAGMTGRHSGVVYRRKGGDHQASAANEYPASDSGGLLKSIRTTQRKDEATIGTNKFYSKWLRGSSKYMARRRMSDDALTEGATKARPASKGWVAFQRGKHRARNLNG